MRLLEGWMIAVPALISAAGCAGMHEARYVYQDGEYGVVGIPENTNLWPTYYRDRAEALMKGHFPEGHEIVRAEEVVEGSRTTTVKGTNTAQIEPRLPAPLLTIGKIGLTADRSQADSVKIKECRIIYRRTPTSAPSEPFSALATPTPAPYVDPNALERRKVAGEVPGEGAKAGETKADGGPKGPAEKKGADGPPDL